MEDTIAIDAVLLPPLEIWEWAVSLSRGIRERNSSSAILLDETHLPHITLVQACVDNLDDVLTVVGKSLTNVRPLELDVKSVIVDKNGTAGLDIVMTDELRRLHNSLMSGIEKFRRDVVSESFYLDNGQTVGYGTLNWVKNFTQQAGYEKYLPHITLGQTDSPPEGKLKKFTAGRVAVCHLGNHCTCRKILKERRLT